MIKQEFILLGMLREGPKHGYEIKKRIKEILSLFAGISLKSVYYPLEVLKEKGLVEKRRDQHGRRPERFVYTLTKKGQERFDQLLTESFLNFNRPQFSLDLSLYFLRYIKPAFAKRRLRARTVILKKLIKGLSQTITVLRKEESFPSAYILEHNLQMVEAELMFLSGLIYKL